LLDNIGALAKDRQELLWGPPEKNIIDLGVYKVSELKENDFISLKNSRGINSIRLYRGNPGPDSYLTKVVGIIYPKETPVLDVADLLPKVTRWVNTTSQTMGNWTSKEEVKQLANAKIQPAAVSTGDVPLKTANEVLQNNRELTVIGYDILQTPRFKIVYKLGSPIVKYQFGF